MSMGARVLYVALKGQSSNANNLAYLSYRDAARELGLWNGRKEPSGSTVSRISQWFDELEHYGFIVLHRHGSLGVEGKGKAPQWRLTEKGNVASGEQPTRDYLRWDGVVFEPARSLKERARSKLETKRLADRRKAAKKEGVVVKLDMYRTQGTPLGCDMYPTQGTLGDGTVPNAGHTTVPDAGHEVYPTQGTGFYFLGIE
jgi:hypothetical protein